MSQIDTLHASLIDILCKVIGYEEAYHVLHEAVMERCDSTKRQALSIDGGFIQEVASIAANYPAWEVRFEESSDGLKVLLKSIRSDQADSDVREIQESIKQAFKGHNKLKIPGVFLQSSVEIVANHEQ